MIRLVLAAFAVVTLEACHHSHEAERRDLHRSAKGLGRKTSDAFHNAGGHLQKFFTGRDTLSR